MVAQQVPRYFFLPVSGVDELTVSTTVSAGKLYRFLLCEVTYLLISLLCTQYAYTITA